VYQGLLYDVDGNGVFTVMKGAKRMFPTVLEIPAWVQKIAGDVSPRKPD
jgi:hypothetical protein